MPLAVSELEIRRWSVLLWALAVLALTALVAAFYPSIRDDPSVNSLYANLSPTAQGLLGGSDLVSPKGYLNTQVFAFFVPAVLLVFGLGRAAASLAGEEEARTLDLLLAQPISRRSAYVQKAAAIVVWLALLAACVWVPLVLLDRVVRLEVGAAPLFAVCAQMWLMVVSLSLACQAISAATGRKSIGLAVVTAYAFVSYVAYGLSSSVSLLKPLRPLTLWRWYLGNDPLSNGFNIRVSAVLAVTGIVAVALGADQFNRRNLRG